MVPPVELRSTLGLVDEEALLGLVRHSGARSLSLRDPSGDLILAALAAGVERVLVCASTPAERALFELKLGALAELPPQSVRALLGLDAAGRRVWFYHQVRARLSPPARRWWDEREGLVRAGLAEAGAHERALRSARAYAAAFRATDPGSRRWRLALRAASVRAPRWEELVRAPPGHQERFLALATEGRWQPGRGPPWIEQRADQAFQEAAARVAWFDEGPGAEVTDLAEAGLGALGRGRFAWSASAGLPRAPFPDRSPFTEGLHAG